MSTLTEDLNRIHGAWLGINLNYPNQSTDKVESTVRDVEALMNREAPAMATACGLPRPTNLHTSETGLLPHLQPPHVHHHIAISNVPRASFVLTQSRLTSEETENFLELVVPGERTRLVLAAPHISDDFVVYLDRYTEPFFLLEYDETGAYRARGCRHKRK